MKSIEVTIFVEPTPKGRPRSTIIAGHVSTYTPKKTRTAEADIKAAIRHDVMAVTQLTNVKFTEGQPLRLTAVFFRLRPRSLSKRVIFPVTKPDGNNFESLLFDALQHYVYPNDSQITTCTWAKRYCAPGQVPHIRLTIREDD